MKKIKKAYYYFFYKIYKSIEYTSELFGGVFWTDFKASIVIMALEICLVISLGNYFSVVTKKTTELTLQDPIVFIPFTVILVFNYLTIDHVDIWKNYNKEFDRLPKKINRNGSWIVFGIVLFIIANFIFSFYLISQIDWSKY